MTRTLPVLALLLAAASCSIPEDSFPKSYASAHCKKWQRCDRADFRSTWDSRSECIDRVENNVEALIAIGDIFADYDGEAGFTCVREISTMSCDDWNDGQADCNVLN